MVSKMVQNESPTHPKHRRDIQSRLGLIDAIWSYPPCWPQELDKPFINHLYGAMFNHEKLKKYKLGVAARHRVQFSIPGAEAVGLVKQARL